MASGAFCAGYLRWFGILGAGLRSQTGNYRVHVGTTSALKVKSVRAEVFAAGYPHNTFWEHRDVAKTLPSWEGKTVTAR